jgi:tRNA (guanine37-N1)-methyltransferase
MVFHIVTIFPEFFRGPFDYGVVSKAREAGLLDIRIHDLRNWTFDRHKTVDDRPFGGGEGMLLKPEPLFLAVEAIWPERKPASKIVLLSA